MTASRPVTMTEPSESADRDVTERVTASLTAADLLRIFEAAPNGWLLVDQQGIIRDSNAEAQRALGYRDRELAGQPIELLVPERLRDRHAGHREAYARQPSPRPMGIGLELFARRKDGSELPVEIALSPVETTRGTFIVASINDITQRKRLRAFGAGVMQGAEEERQRIARELHDDTAQAVTALVLRLQMARRAEDPVRREELLHQMHGEMLRTAEGIRRILRGLRPPALEEAGIGAAIRAQARDTLGRAGIGVHIESEGVDEHLSSDGKLALYRIVQEALSNIVRHAGASHVTISLTAENGTITATVEDDGGGFAVEAVPQAEAGRGLGIIGMQERATILGGSVALESQVGRGTRVTVRLPASAPVSS